MPTSLRYKIMAQLKAQFVTEWTGDGTEENPNHPTIDDVPGNKSWTDITGQPAQNLHPAPNVYVVEVTAEEAVLDAIADAGHTEIWRDGTTTTRLSPRPQGPPNRPPDNPDSMPSAAAKGLFIASMARRGFTPNNFPGFVDAIHNFGTRREIGEYLIETCRGLPKAKD